MKTDIQIPEKFTADSIKRVAFFGSADIEPDSELYGEVYELAKLVAKSGKVIVNGGGPGIMQAATKGAESVEGESVAVTFYPKDMPEFEGRDALNEADVEIKTANYIERMFGLIYYSDLFICFKGGTGTLSEWSTAWLLSHLYFGNHKPMILYGDFWHEVLGVINKHFFIDSKERSIYKIVSNPSDLMQALEDFEQEIAARK
jgi:uncharacterized protein (TIGR00725 family)